MTSFWPRAKRWKGFLHVSMACLSRKSVSPVNPLFLLAVSSREWTSAGLELRLEAVPADFLDHLSRLPMHSEVKKQRFSRGGFILCVLVFLFLRAAKSLEASCPVLLELPHASARVWIGEQDRQQVQEEGEGGPAEQEVGEEELILVVDVHRQNIPETRFIRADDSVAFSELLRLMRLREEARHLVELALRPRREQGQAAGPSGAGSCFELGWFGDWGEKLRAFMEVYCFAHLSVSCFLNFPL